MKLRAEVENDTTTAVQEELLLIAARVKREKCSRRYADDEVASVGEELRLDRAFAGEAPVFACPLAAVMKFQGSVRASILLLEQQGTYGIKDVSHTKQHSLVVLSQILVRGLD